MRRGSKYTPSQMLRDGSMLGIFSPSEPLTVSRQERMVPSLELLHRNYRTSFAPNALAHSTYMAGTVEERLGDIHALLDDDDVDALVASWGGKSCNQLLRGLPYKKIYQSRKPVVGFSDACVLLNAITAQTGLVTFSGPNIAGKMQESDHWNLDLIRGKSVPPFGSSARECWTTVKAGTATGTLYGGNLSTFVLGLVGTPYMDQMEDVVFFFESASDSPQIVDQYLRCLANAGLFERCCGMIIGDVSFEEQPDYKQRDINDLALSYADEFDLVCARIETFGHGKFENPATPIGGRVRLCTDDLEVELLERVVAP